MTEKQAVGFFGNWAKWHIEQKEREEWEKKKTHFYISTRIWYSGYNAYTICYFARRWYGTESDSEWFVPGTIEYNDI